VTGIYKLLKLLSDEEWKLHYHAEVEGYWRSCYYNGLKKSGNTNDL